MFFEEPQQFGDCVGDALVGPEIVDVEDVGMGEVGHRPRLPREAVERKEFPVPSPSNTGAHFELGVLYAGPLADVERAKAHLRATIDANADHPRARQARAILDRRP